MDFMSSDESCYEGDEEVLVSKPLPWESGKVTHFKQALDDAALQEKSPLVKRQIKPSRRPLGLNLAVNTLPGYFLDI